MQQAIVIRPMTIVGPPRPITITITLHNTFWKRYAEA